MIAIAFISTISAHQYSIAYVCIYIELALYNDIAVKRLCLRSQMRFHAMNCPGFLSLPLPVLYTYHVGIQWYAIIPSRPFPLSPYSRCSHDGGARDRIISSSDIARIQSDWRTKASPAPSVNANRTSLKLSRELERKRTSLEGEDLCSISWKERERGGGG